MSWMSDLCQTYDFCQGKTGDENYPNVLLPLAHSTQNAQVEIVIDSDGIFKNAYEVNKDDAVTIIPVTENSSTRTSAAIAPHPLEDKLEYLAGDFKQFTGVDNTKHYQEYIQQLKSWYKSKYSTNLVKAIFLYVSAGHIVKDLLDSGIFELKDNKLSGKKIKGIEDKKIFIRFLVLSDFTDSKDGRVYRDKETFNRYSEYYMSIQHNSELCYISGKQQPYVIKHPSKIRNTGDKAKLISHNVDEAYKGRFINPEQAVVISYEVSQKAHNALRWLVAKQGFSIGEMTIVAWELHGDEIVDITKSTADAIFRSEQKKIVNTEQAYAKQLELAINGYKANLKTNAQIVILAVEAATPGRLSIRFYQKLSGSEFLNNIMVWHRDCAWQYFLNKSKDISISSPCLKDIATIAFGNDDKVIKNTIERLLPCVVLTKKIPKDIVRAAFNKSIQRGSYKDNEKDKWDKSISIACALIKKSRKDYEKEEWSMALDENCKDRSYLYGRLLGIARKLEEVALYNSAEKRSITSAERYFQQFSRHPQKTWKIIESNLQPYKLKLKTMNKTYYEKQLEKVYDMFPAVDFSNDEPLTELFLLGYNCQLNSFNKSFKEE